MDIVERLRLDRPCISDVDCCGDICIEAADEIELLRKERDGLREALKSIKKIPNSEAAYGIIQTFVDDALKEKE